MPELPEVEYAARRARAATVGRTILAIRVLHPSPRRALPDARAATLVGDVVLGVTRRGKHQLFALASGRVLHVHFRMTGDWMIQGVGEELPVHTRASLEMSGGTRLDLRDPRALATLTLHERDVDPLPRLGPDATDSAFTVAWLEQALRVRRAPIKPMLLDQGIVAGVGNIYASEALWHARLDPRRSAADLDRGELRRVVSGIRRALAKALDDPERYYGDSAGDDRRRFKVYDREGEPCGRCRTRLVRIVQGGRSTYFCPTCQR